MALAVCNRIGVGAFTHTEEVVETGKCSAAGADEGFTLGAAPDVGTASAV